MIQEMSVENLLAALIKARRALCALRELAREYEDEVMLTQYEDGGFVHDAVLPFVDYEIHLALSPREFKHVMRPMSIRSMHKEYKGNPCRPQPS